MFDFNFFIALGLKSERVNPPGNYGGAYLLPVPNNNEKFYPFVYNGKNYLLERYSFSTKNGWNDSTVYICKPHLNGKRLRFSDIYHNGQYYSPLDISLRGVLKEEE